WTPGHAHRARQARMQKRSTRCHADEETRRRGRRQPARRHSTTASYGMTADLSREADDARRTARVLEPPEDVFLLLTESFGRERGIGVRVCAAADVVQEGDEVRVARVARLAIGEMLDRRRIERFTATVREITLNETVVVQMLGTSNHDFAPRS